LKPTQPLLYSRTFSGDIWKIIPDPEFGYLALEIRENSEKSHFYQHISLHDFSEHQRLVPASIDWWSSLLVSWGNLLLILCYENKNNPGPGTLVLYDWVKGAELLTQPGFQWQSMKEGVVAGKISQGVLVMDWEVDLRAYLVNEGAPPMYEIQLPVYYPGESREHEVVRTFLKNKGVDVVFGSEYLEIGHNIVVSYTAINDQKRDHCLLWLFRGETIHLEVLQQDVSGEGMGSFMVVGTALVLIKEKKTIKAYQIDVSGHQL